VADEADVFGSLGLFDVDVTKFYAMQKRSGPGLSFGWGKRQLL
jgi:hypothetical protein